MNAGAGLLQNSGIGISPALTTSITSYTGITAIDTITYCHDNSSQVTGSTLTNLQSLGDYTDFEKIFVNSKDVISFSTMAEFKTKLQALELGRIETVAQLATYINSVEPASLPTIGNNSNFVVTSYVDDMIAKFLGGTGPYGAITLSDMIGILGGVGISTHATEYITVMNRLYSAGELTALRARIGELSAGVKGDYTTVVSSGPPEVINIVDPFDGSNHGGFGSFQAGKIGQIEAACAALISRRNVNADIQTAIDAWNNMFKKINDEKDFQSRIDMNYGFRTNFPDIAYSFVTNSANNINDPGRKEIILGMIEQAVSQGDVAAEYIRAFINEAENKAVGSVYNVRWRAEVCE